MLKNLNVPMFELPEGENLRQPKSSHFLTHLHQFTPREILLFSRSSSRKSKRQTFMSVMFCVRCFFLSTPEVRFETGTCKNTGIGMLVSSLGLCTFLLSERKSISLTHLNDEQRRCFHRSLAKQLKRRPWWFAPRVPLGFFTFLMNPWTTASRDPPFGANINYSDLNFIGESDRGIHRYRSRGHHEQNARERTRGLQPIDE